MTDATTNATEPNCLTSHRLRALQPGESVMFYRGTVPEYDPKSQSPAYDHLLRSLFSEARALQVLGKIEIKESWIRHDALERTGGNGEIHVYAGYSERCWTATGL